jgi:glycosyltransferase involved in cell wall biosynthesis
MTVVAPNPEALTVIGSRLDEVADELLPVDFAATSADPAERYGEVLAAMVDRVSDEPSSDLVWLLLVALSGSFPIADDVQAARRRIELGPKPDSLRWLLEWSHRIAHTTGTGAERIRLVRNDVLVDVDFTAKHDLQTGIQRVVRHLLPRWERDRNVQLVVWTEESIAFREPVGDERARVLRWRGPLDRPPAPPSAPTVLVPWRSTVVLPEVPHGEHNDRLAALAQHSGNRVVVIGYDCIPATLADLLAESEPAKFVRYLALVKHAHVVVGISESATAEFRGFVSALDSQGLPGPRVVACPLAAETPTVRSAAGRRSEPSEVVVVGTHHPRKNHMAVLHAAEVLWREGLSFQLTFLGDNGWGTDAFERSVRRMSQRGRQVTAERGVDDDALWDAYQRAAFSVFPSLHEGYGLPVVESLSFGTPVITSGFGATAELATDGGVVLVDPRDDEDLIGAMRRLLTDPEALTRLRTEAAARPARSWDDYADDLWSLAIDAS